MGNKLVHISIPSRDVWKTEFGASLLRVQAYCFAGQKTKQGDTVLPYVQFATGSVIAELRNLLVRQALAIPEMTHVLFADDDQMFPADTIHRLMSHDVGIVAANIARKESNPRTNSRELVPEGFKGKGSCCWTRPSSTGIQEVDYVGTGLMLIRRDVLEAVEDPRFFYDVKEKVGEDANFCFSARKKGFKTYIDHDLSKEVKHCGTFYWGVEHTDIYQLDLKNGDK